MKNFSDFVKVNREKIFALAEKNTKRNSTGSTTISKNDSWFYEDEWAEEFACLTKEVMNCGCKAK